MRAGPGTAGPTNPFILPPNTVGTDIVRSNDAMELHGKPMLAAVKVEKRNDNGELRNVIKSFAPVTAANAAPAATGQPWATKS